jgi:hypothetical protein
MNVTTEDIKSIPPGALRLFPCEDGAKIRSARSLISIVKEAGLPEGVVNYESRKFNTEIGLIFAIRAMGSDDMPLLNRIK